MNVLDVWLREPESFSIRTTRRSDVSMLLDVRPKGTATRGTEACEQKVTGHLVSIYVLLMNGARLRLGGWSLTCYPSLFASARAKASALGVRSTSVIH